MYRLFIAIASLALACSGPQDFSRLSDTERQELRASNVEIFRDNFGVPHIYGKTDADAVFGLLYAQCEDDFNRIERNYIWATGRLAEVEGESALYSDLRANLYMTKDEAIQKFKESPEWLKELCIAFADGMNYYLRTHPQVKPKLLTHFEPWMPMYFSEGSIGGDIERIRTRGIKEFYDKQTRVEAMHPGLIRPADNEPRGSNGIALAESMTASENTMLLINPHTSFYFRGEVHVVSEEGLNAYGAVTWGQFFVYQGFNDFNGWMHTSTGTDVIDQFEETIIKKENGHYYKYGDEQRPVDSLEVTLQYIEDGQLKDRDFTLYRTHHGPVTHANGEKWVSTALMWDPVNALQQSYIRTKTSSYEEFDRMMDIRTNSSNNTVYADGDGNIAYYHGNFIPRRDTIFDYSKPVDGSNPATDWQGLHTVEESIHLHNPKTGWIQNCNSTPFSAAAEYSPRAEDYPDYMTSYPENFRGIHALAVLDTAGNVDLNGLIDIEYDPYLPGAQKLINPLIADLEAASVIDTELQEAYEILKDWDFTVSNTAKA
jgi:acyl-homoserine lactone acylase PvdQ